MSVLRVDAWCPWRPEEGVGSTGTGTTDGYGTPRRYREPNPGPLQGQQVFLTTLKLLLFFLSTFHPCVQCILIIITLYSSLPRPEPPTPSLS